MSQAEPKLPNFFIVGAPKAGTTSLYHHLDQHPDIYMSPLKEPMYFASELRLENYALELQPRVKTHIEDIRKYLDAPSLEKRFAGLVSEWEDYCRLFSGVEHQRAIGEATPSYLWSKTAPAAIAARIPHAKIIMVLRNPLDRAFSQYSQMANTGGYKLTFQQHLEAASAHQQNDQISALHPFLEYGLYAEKLQRYRHLFPMNQIAVWLYKDTRKPSFFPKIFEFLGVDTNFKPDTSKRYLEQSAPRSPLVNTLLRHKEIASALRRVVPASAQPFLHKLAFRRPDATTMTAAERSWLIDYYRQDITQLESLLQRDLSAWLR